MIALGADRTVLEEAARCLRDGGLVVLPTDTLYGLAAVASQDGAVRRLFEVKGRPPDRPVPLLVTSVEDVERVAASIPPAVRRLMEACWPGGLTIVLHRHPRFRSLALAGGETVAVRVPAHSVALDLLRRVGEPLTGTSANVSGQSPPTTAAEVHRQLGGRVDLVVDGGPSPGGIGSTVVDCTVDPPRVLREGAVPVERVTGILAGEH